MIKIDQTKLHWENTKARDYILASGSKAGVYKFLKEDPVLKDHLPTFTHISEPGEDHMKLLENVKWGFYPKIVRGFHSLDFSGMVDVLKTTPNVMPSRLNESAEEVLKRGKSEEVISFEDYEFEKGIFNGEIGLMVQDFYKDFPPFSIVEHPHKKGCYFIESFEEEQERMVSNHSIVSELDKIYGISHSRLHSREFLDESIKIYNLVKDSGLVPREYSFQMEFGGDRLRKKIVIYQVRLFRKNDHDLSHLYYSGENKFLSQPYQSFGIMQEAQDMVMSKMEEWDREGVKDKKAFYISRRSDHETDPLSIQPENIEGYGFFDYSFLMHGHYRWIMKAPVVLGFGSPRSIYDIKTPQEIKVYSNGRSGGIVLKGKLN